MPEQHQALELDGRSYIRFADPGENSVFDFDVGEAITIEAWVAPTQMQGQYCYIIGKGRTYLAGQVKENHNWSLRLSRKGGRAAISFMFRSAGESNNYHRWESKQTLAVGDGWHHIAVSYVFGDPKSMRGYIDGQSTQGVWEVGGATTRGPMINNDEVWIGSAMAGNKGSTFAGGLDEIALHRRVNPAERLKARYRYAGSQLDEVEIPENQVLVQIFDKAAGNGWSFRRLKLTESFIQEVFAFPQLPKRYDSRGVNIDRPTPLLLHAHAKIQIPNGKHRLLFRSREISRLFVDGELQAETKPYAISQEANGPIWELDRSHAPNIRPLQRGDRQAVVEIEGDGREHEIRLEIQVGLGKRNGYMGEASLGIATEDGDFQLVSFGPDFSLTEDDWPKFLEWDRKRLQQVNRE
ncbi:MAG: LamG domain-containing protein, partial [Planctomycetota bacterium]